MAKLRQSSRSHCALRRTGTFALIALTCVIFSGCMHRRMTIASNPAGALVRVDGKEIGYTPTSVDFTYYGTREVQLLMDGYETQTQLVSVPTPWYQVFPLDFFSDNFMLSHAEDHRRYDFSLQPKQRADTNGLIERGRSLRSEALLGQ